jgi:hypothetical protein
MAGIISMENSYGKIKTFLSSDLDLYGFLVG